MGGQRHSNLRRPAGPQVIEGVRGALEGAAIDERIARGTTQRCKQTALQQLIVALAGGAMGQGHGAIQQIGDQVV
jgi:hypothetical protein